MVAGSTSRRDSGLTELAVGSSVASVRLQELLSAEGRIEIWRGMWPDGRPATVHGLAANATKLEREMFQTGARKLVVAGRQRGLRSLVSVAAVVPSTPAYVTRTQATSTMADLPAFQWDLKRALSFTRELGQALRALHRAALIHGCAIPANVLLNEQRSPILSDAGVVSVSQSYGRGGGERHAYAPYCAPEVRRGSRPSMRADIYAFGRLAAFALSAMEPVMDDGEVPLLDELSDLPEGLVRIIRRCTVAKSDDRYATFEDVLSELDNYQDSDAVGVGVARASATFGRASGVAHATSEPPPPTQPNASAGAYSESYGTASTIPPPVNTAALAPPADFNQMPPSQGPVSQPASSGRNWSHPIERFAPAGVTPSTSSRAGQTQSQRAQPRSAHHSDIDGRYGGPASDRRARLSDAARHISGIDGAASEDVVDLTQLDEQLRSAGRLSGQSRSYQSEPQLAQLRDPNEFTEQPLPLVRSSTPPPPSGRTVSGPYSPKTTSGPYSSEPNGAANSSGPYSGRTVSGPYSGASRSGTPSGPYAAAGPASTPPSWSPPRTQPSGQATADTLRPPSHDLGVSSTRQAPQPRQDPAEPEGDLLSDGQAKVAAVIGLIIVVGALGYSYARATPNAAALFAATIGAVLLSLALPRIGSSALLSRVGAALLFGIATWLLNPTGEVAQWARTTKLTRGSAQERGMRIKRLRDGGELSFGGLDLRATDFSSMDLSHTNFDRSDLRGAKFKGAVLRGASLANANVTGADFSGAVLDGVDISALDGWRSSTCDDETSIPAPWVCQRGLPVVGSSLN